MTKKRRTIREAPTPNVGLIMSVSLFLILLTFFALLNSIAVIDERKAHIAIGSLMGAFGSFQGGLSPLSAGKSISMPTPPIIEEEEKVQDLLIAMDEKIAGNIKAECHEDREVITIDESVLFTKDRSKIASSSYRFLDKLCAILQDKDYPVEIVGHTDTTPGPEKGFQSNWELSSLMAIQVARYFVEKGKILPQRLTPRGCSSYKAVSSNATKQSRTRNRRVEVILHYQAPAYTKRIYRKKPAGIFTYKNFDFRLF
jgi:chemotaxis protein MotB